MVDLGVVGYGHEVVASLRPAQCAIAVVDAAVLNLSGRNGVVVLIDLRVSSPDVGV